MTMILISLATGIIGGVVTGTTVGLFLMRRPAKPRAPTRPYRIDQDLNARITDAANRWAAAQGRPEAGPLAADKLRLLARLNQKRAWRRFD
jgi:hypothetical protein